MKLARGKPTITDVAKKAGVSKSLVSLVMRGERHVSAVRREAVQKAVAELGYRPMVELIDYLRANGFSTWICSGSPVTFTRALSQPMFGIPTQQVLGSHVRTRFAERDGRSVLP